MSTQSGPFPYQGPSSASEEYPPADEVHLAPGEDSSFYRQLLHREGARIFESDRIACEVIRILRSQKDLNSSTISARQINSLEDLDEESISHTSRNEHVFYMIPQTFSWGQLQITQDAFQRLLAQRHVFAPFLSIVHEFGSKTRDEFPKRHTFCGYQHGHVEDTKTIPIFPHHDHELSYLLHYVEENNRNHGNPWSLRQTGVYQQVNAKSHRSAWIFLKLSGSTRRRLNTVLEAQSHRNTDGFMNLHSYLLLETVENWGRYIEYLHSQLRDIDEKACFSKLDSYLPNDYSVNFSDMQTLQRLRSKVLQTARILESCLSLATRLKKHCCSMNSTHNFTSKENVISSIETYAADIKVYQQNIAETEESLKGTFGLLSKVIEFRNIERLQAINTASEKSMFLLTESSSQIRDENKAAASLAAKNHKDAKTIKALTMISVVFLPASLIATIFSSNLVQIQQDDTHSEYLVLATQFWIYVLVSVGLTIVTIACTRLLEGRWPMWKSPSRNVGPAC